MQHAYAVQHFQMCCPRVLIRKFICWLLPAASHSSVRAQCDNWTQSAQHAGVRVCPVFAAITCVAEQFVGYFQFQRLQILPQRSNAPQPGCGLSGRETNLAVQIGPPQWVPSLCWEDQEVQSDSFHKRPPSWICEETPGLRPELSAAHEWIGRVRRDVAGARCQEKTLQCLYDRRGLVTNFEIGFGRFGIYRSNQVMYKHDKAMMNEWCYITVKLCYVLSLLSITYNHNFYSIIHSNYIVCFMSHFMYQLW